MITRVGAGVVAAFALALAGSACQGDKAQKTEDKSQKAGLEGQLERTVSDTEVMREAVAAANTVVRNTTDCEAAKAAIDDARAKLDEAEKKVQTPAGRGSIEALRRQVDRVASACP